MCLSVSSSSLRRTASRLSVSATGSTTTPTRCRCSAKAGYASGGRRWCSPCTAWFSGRAGATRAQHRTPSQPTPARHRATDGRSGGGQAGARTATPSVGRPASHTTVTVSVSGSGTRTTATTVRCSSTAASAVAQPTHAGAATSTARLQARRGTEQASYGHRATTGHGTGQSGRETTTYKGSLAQEASETTATAHGFTTAAPTAAGSTRTTATATRRGIGEEKAAPPQGCPSAARHTDGIGATSPSARRSLRQHQRSIILSTNGQLQQRPKARFYG